MSYGALVAAHEAALAESPRNEAKIAKLSEEMFAIEFSFYTGQNA